MRVVFCSSEVVPFAKTGGLADVAGTLPPVLAERGIDVKIILPRYRCVDEKKFGLQRVDDEVWMVKQAGVEVYFLENKRFFDRAGLYQDKGVDYPDNLERFTWYCLQSLALCKKLRWRPDIIHVNDWQTALIPIYLQTLYDEDPAFLGTKTVCTVHNLGYQGLFDKEKFPVTGLDDDLFSVDGLEFYGKMNILKGGLLFSDKITTVSPTYAREIQTKEFGCGLEGVLQERRGDVVGILNGINYAEWDPATNKALACHYTADTIDGKQENKLALQKRCGLKPDTNVPLLGIITRLADQKGLDILGKIIEDVCRMPVQFVLLGTGEPKYHTLFERIAKEYKNTSIHLTFDAELAYQIYAGSDIFLMPSYYEPCGLGQLISLAFGTIPLVRKTGGLADTVIDYDMYPERGNGFVFSDYTAAALQLTIERALRQYQDRAAWRSLAQRAMKCDFSWGRSADKYVSLYRELKA